MKQFNYLIRRLLEPGMTLVTAVSFGFVLLAALFSQSLYSYQSDEIIRLQKSGFNQLEFSDHSNQDALLIKYDRGEYLQDLTSHYMPYLRSELDALPLVPANPNTENKGIMSYRNYLLNQQIHANLALRSAQGLAEDYYFALYAPSISRIPSGLEETLANAGSSRPAWPSVIAQGLASTSPYDKAYAHNLQDQLPLRLDAFSASGLLYELMHSFRFGLVLLSLITVLLSFDPNDRNLRNVTSKLMVQKILACFLYCAGVVLVTRVLIFALLSLRFGDAEGAMYVVPAWSGLIDQAAPTIYRLRDYLVYLTVIDLSFLLFVTALASLLAVLSGDGLIGISAAILSLLLPGVGYASIPAQTAQGFFTPFHYLFLNTRLSRFDGTIDAPLPQILAGPQQVVVATLVFVLVILVVLPGAIHLKKAISAAQTQRNESKNHT